MHQTLIRIQNAEKYKIGPKSSSYPVQGALRALYQEQQDVISWKILTLQAVRKSSRDGISQGRVCLSTM